jgi:hypothetical protein
MLGGQVRCVLLPVTGRAVYIVEVECPIPWTDASANRCIIPRLVSAAVGIVKEPHTVKGGGQGLGYSV